MLVAAVRRTVWWRRKAQWQAAAAVRSSGVLRGCGHDDAGAEHDVEEGAVGGDDLLRPGEKVGAVATKSVALHDVFVDVSYEQKFCLK